MSSIVTIIGNDGSYDVNSMLESLKHRGPDASSINTYRLGEANITVADNLLKLDDEFQHIYRDKLGLTVNADLYNKEELIDNYQLTKLENDSSCEVIYNIIKHYYDEGFTLTESVKKLSDELDGDYVLCAFDESDYIILRDRMGVKPLYYTRMGDDVVFASEKKALNAGATSLNPRYAYADNKLIRIYDDYSRCEVFEDYDVLKHKLKDALFESVEKRVKNLDRVSLLFSAGVDSSLIAMILKRLEVDVTLYTVGVENSQDLEYAKKLSQDIDLPLRKRVITQEDVEKSFYTVANTIEDDNLMKIGVAMTIYLTTKLARQDDQKIILTGQAADELFGGYNRYKKYYENTEELQKQLTEDLNNMYHVNLERDDKACMKNSIQLRAPYLDRKVINIATQIPLKYLIHSSEDNTRKHILRDVAKDVGLPEYITQRPKKAAQYATGIDKIIRKKLIKKQAYHDYITQSLQKNNKNKR